jgi:hypothetical protein
MKKAFFVYAREVVLGQFPHRVGPVKGRVNTRNSYGLTDL